jgi:hypothetical protein
MLNAPISFKFHTLVRFISRTLSTTVSEAGWEEFPLVFNTALSHVMALSGSNLFLRLIGFLMRSSAVRKGHQPRWNTLYGVGGKNFHGYVSSKRWRTLPTPDI